jgi:small GTP-binding protein
VQLWDTAGQERYRSMVTAYYQQAHGVVLVYDISCRESFENLHFWKDLIENKCNEDTKVLLIGNKSDLDSIREVSEKEGQEYAQKYNYFFMETSAKKNMNGEVEKAFELIIGCLARKEIKKIENDPGRLPQPKRPTVPVEPLLKKKNCC